MGLTRVALMRPIAMLMFILGLVVMGLQAYTHLPVDRFPSLNIPVVRVSEAWQGAAPEDVEQLILRPIEDAVSGINGVDSISSSATNGYGQVVIRFLDGIDTNAASIDVERSVNAIRGKLPADADPPSIFKVDPSAFPVMNIAMTGLSLDQLYTLGNDTVLPAIEAVNGVAQVTLVGGLQPEVEVQVDPGKLQGYGLSLLQVNQAIASQNQGLPGGQINIGPEEFTTRTLGFYENAEALKNLAIVSGPKGAVYLKDVANVVQTHAAQTRRQRFNGQEAVGLIITKQNNANALQVAKDLRGAVAKLKRRVPPGVNFAVVNDTSLFTRAALDDVQRNLYLAVFLCAGVLLVFLHSLRNVFIVVLAIPTSIISTFLAMYALGFNLDMMTLMALALLIGILVDDSVVVLENINRHPGLGETPWTAAFKGRSEIGLAAIAITLTDVVVYLPVAFLTGVIGQLFREFGLTIVAATLFSLFISFTLTPMLASRWLKGESLHATGGWRPWMRFTNWWEDSYERLAQAYRALLTWALAHRPTVVAIGVSALLAAYAMVYFNVVGSEYAPQEDDSLYTVNVKMPAGTALSATSDALKKLEAGIKAMPETQTVFSSVGVGGGGAVGQSRYGQISVGLVDKSQRKRTIWQIVRQVRQVAGSIPDMQITTSIPSALPGGFGSAVDVDIIGPDINELAKLAGQVSDVVSKVPGTVELQNTALLAAPEWRATLNRQAATDLGITASDVSSALRTAVQGTVASQLRPEGQDQQDIRVMVQGGAHYTQEQLANLPMVSNAGQVVTLGQVANIQQVLSVGQINRQNRNRVVTVTANAVGRSSGDVMRDVTAGLKKMQVPPGYIYIFGNTSTNQSRAFAMLFGALGLSVVLVYMLMAALYESFVYPLSVLLSLPLALVGGIGGLWATGQTVNIFSLIGMIMLMGLVAKNAILLVDYTNTLRARGMGRNEAIVEAGYVRLRPILMTTATVLLSMIPLALKVGSGAESRSPMAAVVLGGVFTSGVLTLVVVPAMYTYFDNLQNWLLRFKARARPAAAPVGTAGAGAEHLTSPVPTADRGLHTPANGEAHWDGTLNPALLAALEEALRPALMAKLEDALQASKGRAGEERSQAAD